MKTAAEMIDEAIELVKTRFKDNERPVTMPYIPFELCLRAVMLEQELEMRSKPIQYDQKITADMDVKTTDDTQTKP